MIKEIFTGSDEQSHEKEKEISEDIRCEELRLRNLPGCAKKRVQRKHEIWYRGHISESMYSWLNGGQWKGIKWRPILENKRPFVYHKIFGLCPVVQSFY